MDRSSDIEVEYGQRLAALRLQLARDERRHVTLGNVRLAIVAVGLLLLWRLGTAGAVWLLVPFAAFVLVGIRHGRAIVRMARTKRVIAHYEDGLARIRHEWIGRGRTGDGFRPADHLYADDLDLFGRGSLFELLATTRTRAGEETLARWLLVPAPHDEARARQQAVRELAGRTDLREVIAALGEDVTVAVDAPVLRRWASADTTPVSPSLRIGLAALAATTMASLVWWWSTDTAGGLPAALLVGQILVALRLRPRVAAVEQAIDEPAHDLDVLAGLLRMIEQEQFTCPHLQHLQASLAGGGRPASAEIAGLSRRVALLASRRNVLFALPAALMLWGTQWALAIEAWRDRAGRRIPHWLDVVGEFEALVALGGFAAEHPDYVFPELIDGPAQVRADALAHPALGTAGVANDLALGGDAPRLMVVSGSNMSGKSTWLRTIGTAVVLARMGAPVRARAMTLTPLAIGASIRVLDSLTEGRSRFFSEVLRLKAIVDLARQRPGTVLFLLDEILSGTNSHDRRIGAEAIMTTLVRTGAVGLVTTHDLALAAVPERLVDEAANAHFADQFVDRQMTFDYRLRPGVVQTSNALALLQAAGIDVRASGE
ncbi:MAG: DNA mismatch repair protein MutS [Acidobacteriota bacterium]